MRTGHLPVLPSTFLSAKNEALTLHVVCCGCLVRLFWCFTRVATEAQKYYEYLAAGDAVRFLEGKAGSSQLPAAYGEQLLKAIEQYQEEIKQKHGGILSVRISDNSVNPDDTTHADSLVNAFLILCYADSTQEEILVPMVQVSEGEWRMK